MAVWSPTVLHRGSGGDSFSRLESKRITDVDEVIHGRARQARPDVEIDLMERTQLVGRTEVQQVPGSTMFGKIARAFDERVPRPGDLPVEKECRFPCEVAGAGLRRPMQRRHSGRRPVFGKLPRPGQLQARLAPVTGHAVCTGRKTREPYHRCVESTLRMSDLLLDSQSQIAETRSKCCEVIVRNRKPQLGRIRQAEGRTTPRATIRRNGGESSSSAQRAHSHATRI